VWSGTHTPLLGPDGQVELILQHTVDGSGLLVRPNAGIYALSGIYAGASRSSKASPYIQKSQSFPYACPCRARTRSTAFEARKEASGMFTDTGEYRDTTEIVRSGSRSAIARSTVSADRR
jgi:hypothetical protein